MPDAQSRQIPDLHGVSPERVIAAIKDRKARRLRNDSSDDGRKIALVIEGGGMRGVQSAGGLVAMSHLGYNDIFDIIYATSAGAMNAGYFLSDQANLGIRVYFEDLASRRFVNPLRPWKMLDVDYVFDHVITVAKPLNVARILASPTRLMVAVMDRETGQGHLVDAKQSRSYLLNVLKAAVAIPVFYNRAVSIDGRGCMDGGLLIPFPLQQAIAEGCTDIFVMLTRAHDHVCDAPGRLSQWFFNRICARRNRRLASVYRDNHLFENETRSLAMGRKGDSRNAHIATICTLPTDQIHRTTLNAQALKQAALEYGRRTLAIFGRDAGEWSLSGPKLD